MSNKGHRGNAEAARAAAAESNLPNVRARYIRSAEAHEAAATRDENAAAGLKVRQAETAARRAKQTSNDDEPRTDGKDDEAHWT